MLKIQCRCGHKIAVPHEYGGKRIKCPKCQGALLVPMGKAGAPAAQASSRHAPPGFGPRIAPAVADAPTQEPTHEVVRNARAVRHARERQRKSHNTTVAMIAGVMVLLGLGLMLIIGGMNRPEPVDVPDTAAKNKGGGGDVASTTGLKTIGSKRSDGGSEEAPDTGATSGDGEEGVTIAGQRFTNGDNSATPVATASTYDAAGNLTTLKSQPSAVSIGGRIMTLTVTAMHDGKDIKQASQVSAQVRIKGDFTGMISAALSDDPLLTIEVDGREHDFRPTKREGGEAREGENAPELLPNQIEYLFDRGILMALSRGSTIKTTLGATEFAFTPEQLAMFKGFVPAPAKAVTPAKVDDKEMDDKDAPKAEPTDEEKPADDAKAEDSKE